MKSLQAIRILAAALVIGGGVVLLLRDAREEVPVPESGSPGGTASAPTVPGALASDPPRPVATPKAEKPPPVAPPAVAVDPLAERKSKSMDNLRSMMKYFAASVQLDKPWPGYSGAAFVLWLVASNKIDRRDPKQLEILFSPGDVTRSLERAGGVAAYARLTLESLKAAEPGRAALTSYAGRRHGDREHVLTSSEIVADSPILADLSFPDGVIVGLPSGEAKWLTREELGLGPNDPIVAGDASKSPILQHLSSD